jgi:MSHA type pilus biogenesis protein MshL
MIKRSARPYGGSALALGLVLAACLALAVSCAPRETSKNFEALQGTVKKEKESLEALRQQEAGLEKRGPEPVPPVEPILPSFNPLEETKISVQARNEPLQDILYTVAGNAGLNLVVEPELNLDNRVTVSFESAPAAVVVDRLLKAYDFAWEISDNVLYVKRFEEKLFRLDFMNSKISTSISSGGDIFGTSLQSSGSSSTGSGSQTGRFQMEASLGKGNEEGSLYGLLIKTIEPILNVSSSGGASTGETDKLVLDSVAGTIYVRTTPRKMKSVEMVISNMKKNLSRQVVIDARFLEVELSDNYNLGIQWNVVATKIFDNKNLALGMTLNPLLGNVAATPTSTSNTWNPMLLTNRGDAYGLNTQAIDAMVSALETFGKVRTVSNPHVRARHAQPALFTTGKSEAYIKKITTTTSGTSGTTSTSSEDAQAFTGVMLGVVPFINEDGTVELQIFPIVSAADLSKTSNVGDSKVTLPVVNVKNVSTSAKARSGDVVILGGLIDKSQTNTDNAVPGVSQLPLVGDLFKSTVNSKRVRELVVLLSVQVIQ